MECNRDEALRAKQIAENKMQSGDFEGGLKFALKANNMYAEVENIAHILTVCEVHIASQNKLSGGSEMDWYGVLQTEQSADEAAIKKQYRKLALRLHPDKNKFAGAEAAFKLIGEANRVLGDKANRSLYDMKYKASVRPTATKTSVRPTATKTSVRPTATKTSVRPTATKTSVRPTATKTSVRPTATKTSSFCSKGNAFAAKQDRNGINCQNNNFSNSTVPNVDVGPKIFVKICGFCSAEFKYTNIMSDATLHCPRCMTSFIPEIPSIYTWTLYKSKIPKEARKDGGPKPASESNGGGHADNFVPVFKKKKCAGAGVGGRYKAKRTLSPNKFMKICKHCNLEFEYNIILNATLHCPRCLSSFTPDPVFPDSSSAYTWTSHKSKIRKEAQKDGGPKSASESSGGGHADSFVHVSMKKCTGAGVKKTFSPKKGKETISPKRVKKTIADYFTTVRAKGDVPAPKVAEEMESRIPANVGSKRVRQPAPDSGESFDIRFGNGMKDANAQENGFGSSRLNPRRSSRQKPYVSYVETQDDDPESPPKKPRKNESFNTNEFGKSKETVIGKLSNNRNPLSSVDQGREVRNKASNPSEDVFHNKSKDEISHVQREMSKLDSGFETCPTSKEEHNFPSFC